MKNILLFFFLFISFFAFSQQIKNVDFKSADVWVVIDAQTKEVSGQVIYSYQVLKDTDSIYLDAVGFTDIKVFNLNEALNFKYDGKKIVINKPHKKSEFTHSFKIQWKVKPKKAMYFIDWNYEEGTKQVWTQGQGKYTSHWLPSFDDMNEKVEFDLSITFDKDYEVIANGNLINRWEEDSTTTWRYDMEQPMSSYLVALAIGDYNKKVGVSKSGIPLEMYYYPDDSLKFEPTYRYTKQMFDFLEEEIGVPYPWGNYKQIPVKDFLYAGMENTSATIFSDAFVVDSIAFVDKNYVNVNAHELAHQWFGNLVTETSGTHHWLQEGFATYYALLAERDVFGGDYYYWRLYEYAQELMEQDKAGQSTSLLDPKSSSATFYKKGALILHVLKEKIGEKAFKIAVKNYLQNHQFKNVETLDFISEVEKASEQDLGEFVKNWLESVDFNYDLALESLKKSVFIQKFLIADCEAYNSKCKDYLRSRISDEAKAKVVSQIPSHIKKEDFQNSLKVRQAIALSLSEIPLELKKEYESLLNDKSYLTIETALFTLWKNFPEDRNNYLQQTKGIQGFNDKNIRILWLTLALITEGFEPESKTVYFEELTDYTSGKYSFEIRMNAFRYLTQIQACNDFCKENLQQSIKHHVWQFSKFAKEVLKQ